MIDVTHPLQLARIQLKDFRCFDQREVDLDSPIVLIHGFNGTGKTSLLEALYYACYLRSFRTHLPRDLIALGKDSFFIKLIIRNTLSDNYVDHTINIGFTGQKRLVKIDNKATISYKDLLSHYRIVSLTEDDLMLIKEGPQERRSFVDQALMLNDPSFIAHIKKLRAIVDNRNALFKSEIFDKEAYSVWTKQLWEQTQIIQTMRKKILKQFEVHINSMLIQGFDKDLSLFLSYQAKKGSDLPFEQFLKKNEQLLEQEIYFKRSVFGAHVDDFSIVLEGKQSRSYASRGQQKMIVLLIKAAQIKQLTQEKGPVIFLLDDFMTDFDAQRGKILLSVLLGLNCQLIFTSPHKNSPLEGILVESQLAHKIITM
jgi:DNA replication and repair protein RecF